MPFVRSVGFLWGAIAGDLELWGICGDARDLLRASRMLHGTPASLVCVALYRTGASQKRQTLGREA